MPRRATAIEVPRTGISHRRAVCVAIGLLIWMFAYFILLPRLDPVLRETYLPAYIVQHIVYGMVTGLLYSWLCPHSYI